ncbi:MAG: antiviral reverse transcriptase Drt3a, partial [Anaerolineales bacterium]
MNDPTFHHATLARCFVKADFRRDSKLLEEDYRVAVVDAAVQRANLGFNDIIILESELRKNKVYRLADLSDQLIVRHINKTIRRVTGVKQANRTAIVNSIVRLSEEGLPFRVYKLDIANFYETTDPKIAIERARRDDAYSTHFTALLRSFFVSMAASNILGLPRGLSISATLSELLMRDFDRDAMDDDRVQYYARFVDDIVIITSGKENPRDFLRELRKRLIPGIDFNYKKTRIFSLSPFNSAYNNYLSIDAQFDFLGYQISIHHTQRTDGRLSRKVLLDLSKKKERRVKSRLYLSFASYRSDGDFNSLLQRIRLL